MSDSSGESIHATRTGQPNDRDRRASARLAIAAVLLSTAMLPQTSFGQATGKDWTTPGGTLQGTRYSSLTQITAGNVATLRQEFSRAFEAKGSGEGQPLVVGDTLYVVTPFPNNLIAFDLRKPGSVRWKFEPQPNKYAEGVACCDVVNRGPAYGNGKIVYNLLDDSTVAVDAVTGKEVWRTRLGDVKLGETTPGAPIIIRDKVIIGNAGGELGVRGWVLALDLNTGKELWRAYNTGPDREVRIGASFKPFYAKEMGVDLGVTTWSKSGTGTIWQHGGATVWNWFTYDPELNLIFYGTSNPGVWNPDMRPGDNKWAASIVARNPDTGEAVWANQLTPHESWDYDAISESIVTDLTIDGVSRRVVVHFDKNGFGYTLDARTGEVLVAEKFGAVTWATHVDRTTGVPAVVPSMWTHEGVVTKDICPSPLGAKNYVPAAYSPKTRLFYVPAINFCWDFEPLRAIYIPGAPFGGIHSVGFRPGPGGNMGEFLAWDATTGTKKWSIKEPLAVYSGVLATEGNVVFYGTLDRKFKAVDAQTGALLFEKAMPCGVTGNPITFLGPDGKQRVAIYTGLGWLAGGFAGGTCKGSLHVFKLP